MATITGTSGNDILIGTNDPDSISGLAGDDSLEGGIGNDRLRGDQGADTQIGGEGDDVFEVRFSDAIGDSFVGGAGFDTILNISSSFITAANFTIDASVEEWDNNNQQISGTSGDDTLDFTNTRLVNTTSVYGSSGDDTIKGSDQTGDFLRGGGDNDQISGQGGDDTLDGENGVDALSGGAGNDSVLGGSGTDRLNGDGGDDSLFGDADNDFLSGGADNDFLNGGAGRDVLNGGAGNDTLVGGDSSIDVMIGGSGADVFQLDSASGADLVRDFSLAQGDQVEVIYAPVLIGGSNDVNGNRVTGQDVGSNYQIAFNGQAVANIVGGAGLDLDAILLNDIIFI